MAVIKSCGLLVVALVAIISCGGGDSESNLSNDSSSQQDLKDSYSFTLPVEIKSDQSINLTLATTKSNGAPNVTVQSWSSSLTITPNIQKTGEGVFSFVAPQVRKRTPLTITA